MHTVNENVTADQGLRIAAPTLEKEMEFILLPNSPPIISIGQRCMVDGYEFHWPRGQAPYMLKPDGKRIDLIVDNFVPYVSAERGRKITRGNSGSRSTTVSSGCIPTPAGAGVLRRLVLTMIRPQGHLVTSIRRQME